jgi:hypothetical protein
LSAQPLLCCRDVTEVDEPAGKLDESGRLDASD